MNTSSTNSPEATPRPRSRSMLAPVCVSFFLGVAATVLWFHFSATPGAGSPNAPANGQTAAGQPAVPAPPVTRHSPSPSPAVMAAVKQAVPNYASVTPEQGAEILRQAALKQFAAAAKEMETQVSQAEAELSNAKNSGSAADQQAALQHLRQIQAEQTAKLQQIAANLQLQTSALNQLKSAATNSAR